MRGEHESIQNGIDAEAAAEHRLKIYEALYLLGVRSFSFYSVSDGRSLERRIGAAGEWHNARTHGTYSLNFGRGERRTANASSFDLYTEPKYLGRYGRVTDILTGDGTSERESVPISTVADLLSELDTLVPYDTECWVDLPSPEEVFADHQRLVDQDTVHTVGAVAGSLALTGYVLVA